MKKYDNFSRALIDLHEGLKEKEPYSTVVQTGLAALFAICFEQAWKLMKQVLEDNGRHDYRTGAPKAALKLAYQCGMISDIDGWLELLEKRNVLAHTYSEESALEIIRLIKEKYIFLFDGLKKEIDERWSDEGESGKKA